MFNDLILAFHKDMHDKNKIRIDDQKKQYVYYSGNSYEIKSYLEAALLMTYAEKSVEKMQLQFVNLTKKIINQMAIVYRDPAMRHILIEEKKTKIEKTTNEEGDDTEKEVNLNAEKEKQLTEQYNTLLPDDVNIQDKRAHRLGSLQNTILTQVMMNESTGKIKSKTRPSYLYDIIVDGDGNIIEVSYSRYYTGKSGELEEFKIYWTDELLFMRDSSGNEMNLPKKDDARQLRNNDKNPFSVLPFVQLTMVESDYAWGEGANDIVNVNEQVNFLLTKLINRDIVLGEGVLVGTNLNLSKKGREKEGESEVRASVDHPITIDGVRIDDVIPSLQFVSTNPQIQATRDAIDWYIMYVAGLNGLRGSDIISQIKDTSDYQKVMDAVDQMELRKDDIEPLRNYEKSRFDITVAVNNSFVGTDIGKQFKLKAFPDGLVLKTDFADVVVHKTPQDLRDQRDWELPHGLSTVVDWMIEDNPDLTEPEAKERIEKNKKATEANDMKFNKPISRLDQLIAQQKA